MEETEGDDEVLGVEVLLVLVDLGFDDLDLDFVLDWDGGGGGRLISIEVSTVNSMFGNRKLDQDLVRCDE